LINELTLCYFTARNGKIIINGIVPESLFAAPSLEADIEKILAGLGGIERE
jgi:hypothetical protein